MRRLLLLPVIVLGLACAGTDEPTKAEVLQELGHTTTPEPQWCHAALLSYDNVEEAVEGTTGAVEEIIREWWLKCKLVGQL